MSRKTRLDKLERSLKPTRPALLFLTRGGLRDPHNQPVAHAPVGAKVIVGIDPSDI